MTPALVSNAPVDASERRKARALEQSGGDGCPGGRFANRSWSAWESANSMIIGEEHAGTAPLTRLEYVGERWPVLCSAATEVQRRLSVFQHAGSREKSPKCWQRAAVVPGCSRGAREVERCSQACIQETFEAGPGQTRFRGAVCASTSHEVRRSSCRQCSLAKCSICFWQKAFLVLCAAWLNAPEGTGSRLSPTQGCTASKA